jgi:hypothetical protein
MIVEQRTYTLKAGAVNTYLELYEREIIQIQTRHLPRMVGYFSTEIGPLNQIVHMWAYTDLEERTRCRAALGQDPEWQAGARKLYELIATMENKILVPTPFSPIR